jgi:hypothetical protein
MKVFWSWQSDTPGKIGRHFVRDTLALAINELKETPEIAGPDERDVLAQLHLDQDRKGVPGSPDLARLILDKIEQSSVFIADVTPIGFVQETGKKLLNSNVAIELGYALHSLTDRAILMVLNRHYGDREDLPFDLQSKAGPLIFDLPPDADKHQIAKAAKQLKGQLKDALKPYIDVQIQHVQAAVPFPEAKAQDGPARFRARGEPLGVQWSCLGFGSEEEIFLAEGPALWLRLMPIRNPGRTWPAHELCDKAIHSFQLQPFSWAAALHGIRSNDGFGQYSMSPTTKNVTNSVAFAFETGEIWSIDTQFLQLPEILLPLENHFVKMLHEYAVYLSNLGIKAPYRWICGLSGVKNFRARVPVPEGSYYLGRNPLCLAEEIVKEGRYDGEQAPITALHPFFELVFEKCGLARPAHLPR